MAQAHLFRQLDKPVVLTFEVGDLTADSTPEQVAAAPPDVQNAMRKVRILKRQGWVDATADQVAAQQQADQQAAAQQKPPAPVPAPANPTTPPAAPVAAKEA